VSDVDITVAKYLNGWSWFLLSIEDSFIVLAWSPDLLTEREMEME